MRLNISSLLVLVLLPSIASVATAQNGSTAGAVVASPAAAPPADADVNLDRGFLLPTAMTQPAGSLTYNNYELLLHGITYGVTDHVQASATVLSPIFQGMPFFGIVAVKAAVLERGRFHLALQGDGGLVHAFDVTSSGSGYLVGGGALTSFCLRNDCSSLLSASASYNYILAGGGGHAHSVVYGGSIVHRVGTHVKLLGEVTSAFGGTSLTDTQNTDGVLAGYGLRLFGSTIAADIGFLKPVSSSGGSGGFLMGLPFANFSYRWQ
jgi:hypothetical protein